MGIALYLRGSMDAGHVNYLFVRRGLPFMATGEPYVGARTISAMLVRAWEY